VKIKSEGKEYTKPAGIALQVTTNPSIFIFFSKLTPIIYNLIQVMIIKANV